jgi:hypothetical protein
MANRYTELTFTDTVRRLQEQHGSRASYARLEDGPPTNAMLGPREAAFIAARDSLYMATVSQTGWPYVQHRGGPGGFVRVLDATTIGFADFRGNRQYTSVGNLADDDRVALILVDHANRERLKLLGRARSVEPADTATLARLEVADYRANVERGIVIAVEAFDWNCPQHIPQLYSAAVIDSLTAPLHARIAELEARLNGSPAGAPIS